MTGFDWNAGEVVAGQNSEKSILLSFDIVNQVAS